jgi:hypothetical protein
MAETRKLAAILAANVVGYSKLDALHRRGFADLRLPPPNIGHVLFVLVSGNQTAFAFDTRVCTSSTRFHGASGVSDVERGTNADV